MYIFRVRNPIPSSQPPCINHSLDALVHLYEARAFELDVQPQSKVDRGQASLVKDLQELEGARLGLFGLEYLDSHLNISSAV